MKHNFPFLIAMLLFLISLCFNIYLLLRPNPYLIETTNQKIETSNMLSMMLETETGKYEESKNNTWPDNHYVYNDKLSGCENGSTLIWDEETRSVKVNAQSSDRCYLYFDHEVFTKYLINLYQKDGDNNIYYHDKIGSYINSNLEAGDLSYRYSGSSESVENYVCLDGVSNDGPCQNGDADLYRIIGLFPNDSKEYEIKLIKATLGTITELGDKSTAQGGAYSSGNNYYWNYTGSGTYNNMWQKSNLNKINLNDFYYNYITTKVIGLNEHITEHKWTTGGLPSLSDYTPKQVYDKELGTEKIQVGAQNCYDADYNTGKRECTDEDLTYTDQIGLMYLSDYGYAAYPKAWNIQMGSDGYDQEDIKTNNWLYMGLYEWTVSRFASSGYHAGIVTGLGNAGNVGNGNFNVSGGLGARPCFYLDVSTKIASGNGTYGNPYRLNLN